MELTEEKKKEINKEVADLAFKAIMLQMEISEKVGQLKLLRQEVNTKMLQLDPNFKFPE